MAVPKKSKLTAIILAAGKGTRMKSPLPKVLHPVAGRPMIERVIRSVQGVLSDAEIRVVVGHGQNLVRTVVEPLGVRCYIQEQQLGTADAVRAAQIPLDHEGDVLILNGDHPLIRSEDISTFRQTFHDNRLDLAVITAKVQKPGEFGRIIRSGGILHSIVEAKDASAETLKIREINTGIYLLKASVLTALLPKIQNNNSKNEFYLTDLISLAVGKKFRLDAVPASPRVAVGVNSQIQLAQASRALYRYNVRKLMEQGVVVIDPQTVYIEDGVEVGPGSVIYPNSFLRGSTKLGSFCVVESNVFISDCIIHDSVQIKGGSYLERTVVHSRATLGPYARMRPETIIGEEAHVGNFVEFKKVQFGKKSKAGHLTYLGDAEIGEDVNIGCGTITCNYAPDRKKYKTVIGDRVFVGSDTQFIAPISVGNDAVVGSGSTLTKDVPARALAVARGRQVIKENYVKSSPSLDEEKHEGNQ